jgi:FMNH2-dependent dimethyl sulfone monooxygenase
VEYDPDFRQWEANMAKVAADIADMRARAARHGRGMRFGLSAHVICADDNASALAQAEALEAYGARDRVALTAAKALGAGLLGSPEAIATRIDDYAAMGVDTLMLRFHPMLDGLETFVRRVKPLLTCLG